MADNKAKIVVDGDVSPLRQKLRDAGRDLKQFGDEGKSSVEGIGGPLKALQSKFIAIGAVLAGGAVFKEAVAATAEWTQESVDLAAALGMSATAASDLKNALSAEGVNVDEFVTAGQKLSAVLRSNEESLTAVGLVTRDAAGNLRPLNEMTIEAIELLDKYKAGTDRAVAADIMFGRGFKLNGDLAKINTSIIAEYADKQRELGMVMSEENVQAFEDYEQAGKDSAQTMRAMQQTIGNALLPVLTKLANWFVAIGPAAVVVIRGAIGGLIGAFWALKNGVVVVWEVINAMVVTVAEPLRALAAAIVKVGTGDFRGAWSEFQNAGQTMVGAWKGALAEMVSSSEDTKRKIWNLFAQGGPTATPAAGGLSADGLVKDKGTTGRDKAKEAAKALADRIKAEEDAYNKAVKLAEDYEAQWAREYAAVAAAARKSASERMQLDLLHADGARAAGLARIAELEAQSAHEVALGAATQADHLAKLAQFNEMRLAEESRFLAAKREVALQDPDQNPVELERIELEKAEIRRRHAALSMDIQRQQAIESRGIWSDLADSISGLWDKGVQALMNGTLTWKNAFQAIGAEVTKWFATQVVGAMVKDWLAGQVKKIAAMLGFTATEKGIQAAGAATTVGIKGAETTAVASMNAVQAGTGAAASQASIPYIGPILALAAMATIFAAVSAMGKKKSAMGGYDIPKGVNPMTQLHEEEMVLPKQYANAIRGMTKNGGEGGESASAQPLQVNISAVDARGVRDLFMGNQEALVDALKKAHRNSIR
ncbi:MAG: hypothetical protein U0932_14600 [Thiobacillus sp.]|nr:hypothetical protein [Thiobacillus sp.]